MFLESYNNIEETEVLTESVEPTEAGILRAHMEFSEAVESLNMSMIALEHTAIVNEDAKLLEDGKGNYVERAKKYIAEIAAKIANWFRGVIAKIKTKMTNIEKLVKVAEKGGWDVKDKKINGYGPVTMATFSKATDALNKKFATIKGGQSEISEKSSTEIGNILGEKKEIALTEQTAASYLAFLKDARNVIAMINKEDNNVKTQFKGLISGLKDDNASKGTVKAAKQLSRLVSSDFGRIVSAYFTATSEAITAVKASMKGAKLEKGEKEEVAKDRKDFKDSQKKEKEDMKQESVLDMFQID